MNAIRSGYFQTNPLKKDARASLITLGILLAGAACILGLQSLVYASSLRQLLETGQQIWGADLSLMLQILVIWGVVLGVVTVVHYVTQPVIKYGVEFWEAVVTGFPLGLVLPFLFVLGAGVIIYIPLGLLSLLVPEIFPYATLQFAWLAAAYLVFLWIVVGMIPLLVDVFRQRRWYYKFIAVLLFLQLALDGLQCLSGVMQFLLNGGVWQTDQTALLLALIGSLLVSSAAVLVSLRGRSALTVVYATTGIYLAAVVTGNFSERLFGWGEMPAAVVAVLMPLVYLQLAKWILRRDSTALPGLAAGFAGLLSGLLIINLLRLRISGHGWISLLYGIVVVLGLGLALGYFLGRRINRLLDNRFHFPPAILKHMDVGLTAGIMAGMLMGGLLAR